MSKPSTFVGMKQPASYVCPACGQPNFPPPTSCGCTLEDKPFSELPEGSLFILNTFLMRKLRGFRKVTYGKGYRMENAHEPAYGDNRAILVGDNRVVTHVIKVGKSNE